jgi:uncharacterized protein YbaP (TraB family)
MSSKFNTNIYSDLRSITRHYGIEAQVKQSIEELQELIAELEKPKSQRDMLAIVSEIADVRNMIDQLSLHWRIVEEVMAARDFKVKRQLERIAQN